MTSTIGAAFSSEHPSRLNLLLAQEPDKDLDFDEGLEDDESHQSKPPSRRPMLWIMLGLLIIGVAYWTLKPDSSTTPPASVAPVETAREKARQPSPPEVEPPMFRENQMVTLSSVSDDYMLMGDPANTKPGPIVKRGETLTILDGRFQPTGWIYQVQTQTGKTGWISAEKLKSHSS
jgi:hypothetical protein